MIGVQACLNGSRRPGEHPALPLTPAQLAADAAAAVAAGADGVHLHPRSAAGEQTLSPGAVIAAVAAVRAAIGAVPIGVTTAAWVEPSPAARVAAVEVWATAGDPADGTPDFASVNLSEDGALDVLKALLAAGIGVEAGVWTPDDARLLVASGLGPECVRIMLEPITTQDPAAALDATAEMLAVLRDDAGLAGPYLLHGLDATAWPVLTAAVTSGLDTRVGLEDTLTLPDGAVTPSNAELVAAAVALVP